MSAVSGKNRLGKSLAEISTVNLGLSEVELEVRMKQVLNDGIYGMSFSPYEDDQSPATKSQITKDQIRKRMGVIAPYTSCIRSFSCQDGNEFIPEVAKEYGLTTMVGAWIEGDDEINEKEIQAVIQVAKQGHVDMIAVGNEVLLRGEKTPEEIIAYIQRVKEAVPGIPVGYVDAYYLFCEHPEIVAACDMLYINCYPFWEGCPEGQAVSYMKEMYQRVEDCAGGKPIIISETGWPDRGEAEQGAVPSYANAMKYFIQTYEWTNEAGIDLIYFSSFDEEWKVHHEGECGAYWGLWDRKDQYKYDRNTQQ